MSKIYVGDINVTILANCGVDISSASEYFLIVKKPDGKKVNWTGCTIY